jgi:hypothetical protein
MSKQEKVIDLLRKSLPPEYVVAIVANIPEGEKKLLDEDAEDIFYELSTLFNWEKSREGEGFWVQVFSAMKENEKLPKMPVFVEWFPNTYVSTEVGDFIINLNDSNEDVMLSFDFTKPRNKDEKMLREKYLSFCN